MRKFYKSIYKYSPIDWHYERICESYVLLLCCLHWNANTNLFLAYALCIIVIRFRRTPNLSDRSKPLTLLLTKAINKQIKKNDLRIWSSHDLTILTRGIVEALKNFQILCLSTGICYAYMLFCKWDCQFWPG